MKSLKKVTGTFNGTGATAYLCFGAVPHYVKLVNVENSTNPNVIEWYAEMLSQSAGYGGILMTGSSGNCTYLTNDGVAPYEGGDMLTSVIQTTTGYGEGVYLGWDEKDYRSDKAYGTSGADINKWTQASTNTGHWNTAIVASVARIGVGSIIRIKEQSSGLVKEASVIALTGTGESTTNVTLSRTITSGDITFIGGLYSMAPIGLGKVTPAGIQILETAAVNQDGHTCTFEAWWEV